MAELKDHPYADFLHEVAKPARYIGGEHNQIVKDPRAVRISLCLAFPDLYDLGMSHLGTKILYSLINGNDDLLCERAFAPWPDMEDQLRARGLPVLSLENHRPLNEFEAVGFSLQYELTFTNVLNILDLCGIPVRGAERTELDPLILAGGPVATQPEPMAPFIDVFLIGDGEEKLPELLTTLADCREGGLSRPETLVALAKLDGLYVPSLYETQIDARSGFEVVSRPKVDGIPARPQRVILDDLNRYPFPEDSPVAAARAIFDRMSVEIARGCTEGCRFCQAGMIYRPVREREPDQIIDTVLSAIEKGGYDEAGLTTLSTADYSCISPLMSELMRRLRERKVSLSVASLRAYGLDERTLDEMASYRAQGLTFAPEAGTQRMREVINKNVTEEDIARTAERVFERGWKRMKLYFMIGLPTETDEDVRGIMELGARMKEIGRSHHGGHARITISVSTHVPKPHTPFQWVAMDSIDELERKQDLLQSLAREHRLEFRRHDPRTSLLEGVLGRGDRRVARAIEFAWRRGARFDGWNEHLKWEHWLDAIEESGIDPQLYLGTIPLDARLPWDHLDMQLEDRFMVQDYKRAMASKPSPPCGKPAGAQMHPTTIAEHDAETRRLVCYHCGVDCDMDQMRVERRSFLQQLGAWTKPGWSAARGERLAKQRRIARGAAPHALGQGQGIRVRLQLQKRDAEALSGHLDMMRKIPRIFRRAGVEVFYTEGYHPKPAISFGPALALGVESFGEPLEVKLVERMEPAELLRRLNDAAEPGLRFTGGRILEPGEPKLSRILDRATYLLRLPDFQTDQELHSLRQRLKDYERADALQLTLQRKRGSKTVDLKQIVRALRFADAEDRVRLPSSLIGALPVATLYLDVRLDGPAQLKPEELVRHVVGEQVRLRPVDVIRLGLWATEADGSLRCALEPLKTRSLA
jgi:radical SAM family uncharacterized protein/radical SAM-linked protein